MSINLSKLFKRPVLLIVSIVLIVLIVGYAVDAVNSYRSSHYTGWQKSLYFIETFLDSKNINKESVLVEGGGNKLVPDKDLSFNNDQFIFHYYSNSNELELKFYNADGYKTTDKDEYKDNVKKEFEAINDPKIGGMFDKSGGNFQYNSDWSKLFLSKKYSLTSLSANEFMNEANRQEKVNYEWYKHWAIVINNIRFGKVNAPTSPVTLENNPYK